MGGAAAVRPEINSAAEVETLFRKLRLDAEFVVLSELLADSFDDIL